jgi:predicted small secreted protein
MSFLQDLGGFFQDLGEGVTSTVRGFGANIQSQAALNEAQAAAITAAAQTTETRLLLDAEQKKRQHQLIIIVLIVAAAVPLIGMAIYYGLKK